MYFLVYMDLIGGLWVLYQSSEQYVATSIFPKYYINMNEPHNITSYLRSLTADFLDTSFGSWIEKKTQFLWYELNEDLE